MLAASDRYDMVMLNGDIGFNTAQGDLFGTDASELSDGEWHHVVGVFTNGDVSQNQIYIDGKAQDMSQIRGAPNNSAANIDSDGGELHFGSWGANDNYRFSGSMDEIKVFNGSLSNDEIEQLYITEAEHNHWENAGLSLDEDSSLTINPADLLANDSDIDGDRLSISSVQDAEHGRVEINDDGDIVFTPDADYHGDASFTYTVSDGQGGSDTATVNLNVESINDEPVINVVDTTVTEDTAQIIATADDLDGSIDSSSLSAEHGTVAIDGDGNISYTPDADYNGSDTVSISVTDDGGTTTSQTIQLTIDPTQDNPVAVDDGGTKVTTSIEIANASFEHDDHGNNAWNYGIEGWQQSNSRGAGDWNPTSNNYADEASEGENVAWINSGSISQVLDETLEENSTYSLNLDLGDRNDSGTADYSVNLYAGDQLVSTITQGDFALVNGEFVTATLELDSSTLAGDFTGFGEPLKIEIVKEGGGQLNIDNVSLTKTAMHLATDEDTAITIDVLANDTDADGDTLTITKVESPVIVDGVEVGTAEIVEVNGTQQIQFTPDKSLNAMDDGDSRDISFNYSISDGEGRTDSASVNLTVNGSNDAPVITVTDATATEDTPQVIANASDIDGSIDSSTLSAEHGTVTLAENGDISYTPDADYNGSDTVSISVTDDGGATTTQSIKLTIDPTQDSPVAVDDGANHAVSFDGQKDFLATEINVPESGYTVSITFSTTQDSVGIYSVRHGEHGGANDRNIYLDNDGNLCTRVWSNEIIKTDGVDFSDGEVHTVTHVLDGDHQILYVDGEKMAIGDKGTSDFNWDSRIEIGYCTDAKLDYFDGEIGDVQLYDTALSGEEVKSIVDGDTVDNGHLLIHYDFEGDEPFSDKSGNGHDTIAGGNPSIVEFAGAGGAFNSDEDVALTLSPTDLLANDFDADGDALSIVTVQDAENGSVEINDDGDIVFTPDADYHGEASFSYTVSDGQGGESIATVKLNIDSVNDGITQIIDSDLSANTINENTGIGSYTGITLDATDGDGAAISYEIQGDVPFTVDKDGRIITDDVIDFEKNEKFSFDVIATSTDGSTSTQAFSIDVTDLQEVNDIQGTWRSESLNGTEGADYIKGLGGNDKINAGAGDDKILGGDGTDTLYGGAGNDTFVQNEGDDHDAVYGGEGIDKLVRGEGDGNIGLAGNFGEKNSVEVIDAGGNDVVGDWRSQSLDFSGTKLADVDEIRGEGGNDKIIGTAEDDRIVGGDGSDTLYGGAGNDTFVQNEGDDHDAVLLVRGEGDDIGLALRRGLRRSHRCGWQRCGRRGARVSISRHQHRRDPWRGWQRIIGTAEDDRIVGGAAIALRWRRQRYLRAERGRRTMPSTVVKESTSWCAVKATIGLGSARRTPSKIDAGGNDVVGDWRSQSLDFSGTKLADVDEIRGEGGNDKIIGTAEDDRIVGGDGSDTLYGGAGNDTFVQNEGDDHDAVYGGEGIDKLVRGEGDGNIGLAGNFGEKNSVEVIDAGGNDVVGDWRSQSLDFSGTKLADVDEIRGEGGNDKIIGTAEDDRIVGGDGSDTLYGGAGNDTFVQNEGDDHDAVYGGEGIDKLVRGEGDGNIGLAGNFGEKNSVEVIDAGGNDVVGDWRSQSLDFSGTKLADVDEIRGEGGNDNIVGSAGDDTISGGQGNDKLSGGAGDDIVYGNEGNDHYYFSPFEGNDEFHGGEGWTDTIHIDATADPNADPDNPWTITVDGEELEYDLAAGALELDPDTSGIVTLSDGSELSFSGVDSIEW